MSDLRLTTHFTIDEFKCNCKRVSCNAKPMLTSFMAKLEKLRILWDKPLSPTSGQRCPYWNKKVDGAPKSEHLIGNAADFYFNTDEEIGEFIALAEKVGFKGIGFGRHKVHIDDRKKKARWTYDD